MKSTYRLS